MDLKILIHQIHSILSWYLYCTNWNLII